MLNILPELRGQQIVRPRVAAVGGLAQSNPVGRGKYFADVQRDAHFAAGVQIERRRKFHRHQHAVRGQMIRKAALLAVIPPTAFEREKNIFLRPAPIQMVHVRIERMAGGPLCDAAVIDFRLQADVKADAVVITGGNVFKRGTGFAVARADVGKKVFIPNPSFVRPAQGKIRYQKIQPGDGNFLSAGNLIGRQIENERRAVELRREIHAQIRRAGPDCRQEREQQDFFQRAIHFSIMDQS